MTCILTINLGTASTKMSVFSDNALVDKVTLNHAPDELKDLLTMKDHLAYRKNVILEWLDSIGYSMDRINAVAIRVGLLPKPVEGGTYVIEGDLETALMAKYHPDEALPHGSRIILPLVHELRGGRDIPIFTTDPANTNELIPEAKISGYAGVERDTVFHALNHRMVARTVAEQMGRKYEECNFVVAHMGGGISVGAHKKGRVIEVNNCDAETGPFSGSRTGTWPARKLIDFCYSGKYTKAEMLRLIKGHGGVYSYFGTDDMREVVKRMVDGDELAQTVVKAMALQTAKEIGGCCAVLCGDVDRIILTGGIANSKVLTDMVTGYVEKFAPVEVFPGEMENEALANGAFRVLTGLEQPKHFHL